MIKRAIACSDIHCPYEHKQAVNLLLKVLSKAHFDAFIINGDFSDFATISRHTRQPGHHFSFMEEVKLGRELVKKFTALCKGKQRIYCAGNHDFRVEKRLAESDMDGLTNYDELMGWTKNGWRYFPYNEDAFSWGKLDVCHEVGFHGKSCAAQSLAGWGHSIMVGHSHRAAVVYEGTSRGDRRVGINTGWLGDWRQVKYMHRLRARRDWQLGFAVLDMDVKTGNVWANFIPMIEVGKKLQCVVDRELFEV